VTAKTPIRYWRATLLIRFYIAQRIAVSRVRVLVTLTNSTPPPELPKTGDDDGNFQLKEAGSARRYELWPATLPQQQQRHKRGDVCADLEGWR